MHALRHKECRLLASYQKKRKPLHKALSRLVSTIKKANK
jgi:hypothetical protein